MALSPSTRPRERMLNPLPNGMPLRLTLNSADLEPGPLIAHCVCCRSPKELVSWTETAGLHRVVAAGLRRDQLIRGGGAGGAEDALALLKSLDSREAVGTAPDPTFQTGPRRPISPFPSPISHLPTITTPLAPHPIPSRVPLPQPGSLPQTLRSCPPPHPPITRLRWKQPSAALPCWMGSSRRCGSGCRSCSEASSRVLVSTRVRPCV